VDPADADRSAGPPRSHAHREVTAVELGPPRFPWSTLLLALAFVAFSTFVSGGFLLHARDLHLPACSEPSDAAIYPWNLWWTRTAPGAADGSFLFTRRFYWPQGEGLGLYTPTWIYGILSLPLQWCSSDPAIVNVAVALLLWLSSLATALLSYQLARELGVPRGGALLVALLATVASGRLMNAARLNLFCTEFLLAYGWLGLRLLHRGGLGRALLFGASAAALLLQSQPLLFQAFLLTVAFVVFALLRAGSRRELLSRWREISLAAALFLALASPFLWEIGKELRSSPAFAQAAALTVPFSLDAISLVAPNGADRFFGALAMRPPSGFEAGGTLGTVSHFLGVGWLALLLLALLRRDARRAALPAFASAALFFLLALGPSIHVAGRLTSVPGPYALLALVPPLTLDKSPERLVWLVQLCLALAAARAFASLWTAGGAGRRAAALALAAATLLEQGETLPLRSIEPRLRVPDEIAALAREPGSFALLDLPYDGLPSCGGHLSHMVNAFAMGFGAFHEKRIFFGLYPRAARRGEAELAARPLFAAIHAIEHLAAAAAQDGSTTAPPLPELTNEQLGRIRRDLDDLEIGAVLLHDLHEAFPATPRSIRFEVELLGEFLRRLGPKGESALSAGKGYSLRLFRF
jgi:hypothetical protein